MAKTVETWYEIKWLSDGLLKTPKEVDGTNVFRGGYRSLELADKALLEHGDEYTTHVIVTVKRVVSGIR